MKNSQFFMLLSTIWGASQHLHAAPLGAISFGIMALVSAFFEKRKPS